jgi:hypothetical protein
VPQLADSSLIQNGVYNLSYIGPLKLGPKLR